ncbi:DUF6782 family putative metallopeptidase [Actibacterium sp. MT2.3-13A]|uniref:DUF6782 family putative metallopeptidase n=1 Tax=Actibacterium sp. MT2.3-13A TaxID=2828332 RepID=UPI001BAC556F|nr:DUF6782 family putative metallopeptidase [Actibacterium sp. MT2.3-13A]
MIARAVALLLLCLPAPLARASSPFHATLSPNAATVHEAPADASCLRPGAPATSPDAAALAALLGRIEDLAPQPDLLIAAWHGSGAALCLSDEPMEARGYFEPLSNRIVLRRDLPEGARFAILIHELRHVEQLSRGFCPTPALDMQEAARLVFGMEADAQAIATLYAWQLRERGDPSAWDALTRIEHYEDITGRFADAMAEQGDIGIATALAFDQWYQNDWRVEAYYISSCSDHLDRLEAEKRLPGYETLPQGFFAQLCHLPSGRPYDCGIAERFRR